MKKIFLALIAFITLSLGAQSQSKTTLPQTYNFKRGIEALDNNDYDEAATYFGKEIEENPKNGYAHYYNAFATASGDDENMGEVLKSLNLALKYLPKKDASFRSMTYGMRGRVQAMIGDTAKALSDLALSADTDPSSIAALIDRADIYFAQREYDLAEADYNEAIRRDEASTTAYMGLGRNALERKDYEAAAKKFSHVLRLDPSYSRAHSFRARAYFAQKKYREAAADAIDAIEGSQHADLASWEMLESLADSAYIITETLLRAKAVQQNTDALWLFHLGTIYSHTGHYHQAISAFEKYIALNPSENGNMNIQIAQAYTALYNYPAALRHANLAIASDSTVTSFRHLRGVIQYNLDHKQEALDDLDQAVKLSPDNANYYASRGWLKALYGDKMAALDDFTTAITLDNSQANSYHQRARLYQLLGDSAAARRDFNKVVELDTVPSDASSAIFAFAALGDTSKAKEWNDSTLAKCPAPQRAGKLYNAACLYAIIGETDQALSYLREAFECGYRDLVHMGYDTDMDNLRSLPGYQQLVAQYANIYNDELANDSEAESKQPGDFKTVTTEVPFTRESGIYKVKCTINGLPLHFFFDTGAADVTISSVEAAFMLKNGYLSTSDIGGKQYYGNASGEISEGTTITLRSVIFGGLTLSNVKASVVNNQAAPLLLGQTVLSRLGKIEIDYEKNVLKITHFEAK